MTSKFSVIIGQRIQLTGCYNRSDIRNTTGVEIETNFKDSEKSVDPSTVTTAQPIALNYDISFGQNVDVRIIIRCLSFSCTFQEKVPDLESVVTGIATLSHNCSVIMSCVRVKKMCSNLKAKILWTFKGVCFVMSVNHVLTYNSVSPDVFLT